VVDFCEELVGPEERPPALEDGVCYLQHAVVDRDVVDSQARDEILPTSAHVLRRNTLFPDTYVNQGVPPLPEVAICYDADGIAELGLEVGRDGDHETDDLLFDGSHLVLRQPVVPIFILYESQLP
jgi:hypothetical protein